MSTSVTDLSKRINENAHSKGFWANGIELHKKLLLIVSEVAEAMEADRTDNYCHLDRMKAVQSISIYKDQEKWIKNFEEKIKNSFEDELADVAIRVFDLAFQMGIDLEKHIIMKMSYNETRPYKHGKKY